MYYVSTFFIQHKKNQMTGDFDFRCHFGPQECLGNKIHACSIKYVNNQDDLVNYFSEIIEYQEEMLEVAEEVLDCYKYICNILDTYEFNFF